MDKKMRLAEKPVGVVSEQRRAFIKRALMATSLGLVPPRLLNFCAEAQTAESNRRTAKHSEREITAAVNGFLNSLDANQRAEAMFDFENKLRLDWNFRPRIRGSSLAGLDQEHLDFIKSLPSPKGVSLKELTPAQRRAADVLIKAGLSPDGFEKASAIMNMTPMLLEVDPGNPAWDPEFYYFSVFGQPNSQKAWAWTFEGHHLALNFTFANHRLIASSPSFFGVYPAEVQHGPSKGLRVLSAEEDLARSLLTMLDLQQRGQAVVSETAPKEILSGALRKASPLTPAGLQASRLSPPQADVLMKLLSVYARNLPSDITAKRLAQIKAAGHSNIYFAWAGQPERGRPHYYRIQAPSFLIEYDNTQSRANHIHTVWRDFDGDFGLDVLARHYETSSHHEHDIAA